MTPHWRTGDLEADLRALLDCATAVQESEFITAFLEHGASTYADVDRAQGWTHGRARVIALRLREKARRRRAA